MATLLKVQVHLLKLACDEAASVQFCFKSARLYASVEWFERQNRGARPPEAYCSGW